MSKLEKLKKKAAEFEQKRQFDKALALYEQVLGEQGSGDDADVSLFNRVGDLQLRHGRPSDALRSYETAVELYAERGFLNNAIALCHKILRQDPQRPHIHFHLGRISSSKKFRSDARHHFREYVRMMERSGKSEEAVKELDACASQCAEPDDVLLLSADLLARLGREDDAMTRLRRALEHCEAGSRPVDAQAVLDRIRTIDPAFHAPGRIANANAFSADADFVSGQSTPPARGYDDAAHSVGAGLVLIDPMESEAFAARPEAAAAAADEGLVRDSGFAAVEAPGAGSGSDEQPTGLMHSMFDEARIETPAADQLAEIQETDLAGAPEGGVGADHPLTFSMSDELLGERQIQGYLEQGGLVAPSEVAAGSGSALEDALFGHTLRDAPQEAMLPGELAHEQETPSLVDASLLANPPAPEPLDLDDPVPPGERIEPIASLETIETATDYSPDTLTFLAPQVEVPDAGREPRREVAQDDVLADMEQGAGAFELMLPDAEEEPPPPASVEDEELPAAQVEEVAPAPIAAAPVREASAPPGPPAPPAPPAPAADDYVNLGDLLRADDSPRSTRMVTEERAPTGDEQADFVELLRKFKQGVAENVDTEDFDSHYDLGVAFKEMGLLDEAVAAFQRALRGTHHRVRIFEALGQCFLDKGQHAVASSVLARALTERGVDDEQLVGVLYLLGRTSEAMNQSGEALRYYQRVFAVDIEFNDVAERIGMVEQVPQ